MHRRRKVSRRRTLYRTFAPWGLPTASPRKGLLCQSRLVFFTVRCPGGTRATRLGPSRRSHEPRSHPVISVTPKVPTRSVTRRTPLPRTRTNALTGGLTSTLFTFYREKHASGQVANPGEVVYNRSTDFTQKPIVY